MTTIRTFLQCAPCAFIAPALVKTRTKISLNTFASCSVPTTPRRAVQRPENSLPKQKSAFAVPVVRHRRTPAPAPHVQSSSSRAGEHDSELSVSALPDGITGRTDLSPWIALAAFVSILRSDTAVLNSTTLITALAGLQLVTVAATILGRRQEFDLVSWIIAPTFLALHALAVPISVMHAATLLFGYQLCVHMKDVLGLGLGRLSTLVWTATLLVSVYAGYGPEWYVILLTVMTAMKFVKGMSSNTIPLLQLPLIVASCWSLYTRSTGLWVLCVVVSETMWSAVRYTEKIMRGANRATQA